MRIPTESAPDAMSDNGSSTTGIGSTTSRMVDRQFGLRLSEDEKQIITNAFKTMDHTLCSLNQTLAPFTKTIPTVVDFEVKAQRDHRDPKVQLAVWASALYSKRGYHGWDTSMPVPGITIIGDEWQCFLTFKGQEELVGNAFPALEMPTNRPDLDHDGPYTFRFDNDYARHVSNSV